MTKYIFMLFFTCISSLNAQEAIQLSLDYLLSGRQEELVQTEVVAEQLRLLLHQPIDINTADIETLSKLPLLNADQAQNIVSYRTQNGKYYNLYELKHLQFSAELIKVLSFYLEINAQAPSTSDVFALLRYQRILEKQKGYADSSAYLGTADKLYIRFRLSDEKINLGFTAEKDPGEAFLNKYEPNGFDFYSAFAQYKNKKTQFIIGDFTVNTGQGLTFSNGYRNSFTTSPLYANLFQHQIRPYTASDENSFFRGLCYSKKIGNWVLQPFVSYKKIDATISNGNINTLLTSGLHRTTSELNKKDNAIEFSTGSSVLYAIHKGSVGFNTLAYTYNLPYLPDSTYYNANFSQRAWQFINSIDYTFDYKNFNFFGEFATSAALKLATIHGAVLTFNEQLSASVRLRYYDPFFINPYAASYAQSTGVKNESGCDISLLYNVTSNQQITLSYDNYTHPWLRYGIKQPTRGDELSILFQSTVNKQFNFYLRFQNKKNVSQMQVLRAHLNWNISLLSTLSARSEVHFMNSKYSWLTYFNIAHKPSNWPIHLYFRYCIFNVSDYAARIYTYENDLLYSASLPFFDGGGNRAYTMISYPIHRNLSFNFRFSISAYDNKNSLGSDKDIIATNHKSEFKLQLLWKK
jgi:hypothetical protein